MDTSPKSTHFTFQCLGIDQYWVSTKHFFLTANMSTKHYSIKLECIAQLRTFSHCICYRISTTHWIHVGIYPYDGDFLLFVFGFEGTYLTTRDAGKINFWVVHVVAQVASNSVCGWVSSHSVMAHAWWHGSVRIGPAKIGSPSSQKPLRKDTSAWCGYPCQDQKWTYKGTSPFYQINSTFLFWNPSICVHQF